VEERAHLTASGPALLEAVLSRIKAAEERLAATRYAPHHLGLAYHLSMLTLSKEKPLLLIADQQLPDNVSCNSVGARAAYEACLCYLDHAATQLS